MTYNRLIFKTSSSDEIYYLKDTVLIKFNHNRNVISNSPMNGGIHNNLKYVFNHHLSQQTINFLEKHDLNDYLIELSNTLGFNHFFASGLVTLASMKNTSIVTDKHDDVEVTAVTTAGVRVNATRAGDKSSFHEKNGKFHHGTINTILLINSKLNDNTLVEAFMTSSEAKTVALNNLNIPSQFSNGFATGTGTDGLIIASDLQSDNTLTNANKHSKLGEMIANCIIESITSAIKKQVWITPNSQSNVLVLLNRYKLNINEFYESLNESKEEFISRLKYDSKIQENIMITASILNLMDNVTNGIVNKKHAYEMSKLLINHCMGDTVNKLLFFWIYKFLK